MDEIGLFQGAINKYYDISKDDIMYNNPVFGGFDGMERSNRIRIQAILTRYSGGYVSGQR